MDAEDRQRYIVAIKALANDINLTEAETERIRQSVEKRHEQLEQSERERDAAALDEEINALV